MAKAKLSIDFKGYDILKKQLDSIGGKATERAVESSLKASQQLIARQVNAAMTPHNNTGKVKEQIVKNNSVVWTQGMAEIGVGFNIRSESGLDGLPSIFLMYGTQLHGQPHIAPDRNLYNAVYGSGTRKRVKKIQKETFQKVIERALKK